MQSAAVSSVRQVWTHVSKDLDVSHARAVLAEVIGAFEAGAALQIAWLGSAHGLWIGE